MFPVSRLMYSFVLYWSHAANQSIFSRETNLNEHDQEHVKNAVAKKLHNNFHAKLKTSTNS